jgi:hypothetical protein
MYNRGKCRKPLTVMIGMILENSHIPLTCPVFLYQS